MYTATPRTAPTSGAMRNSQSWLSAWPPTSTAGPKLRAGFTDAPSMGIPMMLTRASARPTTMPATGALASLRVAARTTSTNTEVRTTSVRNAPPPEECSSDSPP
jgi:hypothetical protein